METPQEQMPTEHSAPNVGLRIADHETARVVAICSASDQIVGAGCLVSETTVLTCHHVATEALGRLAKAGDRLQVVVIGLANRPTVAATVVRVLDEASPETDLALLTFDDPLCVSIPQVEFAAPLRHGGKKFSVLGFPGGHAQGRNATGTLHAIDAAGLVQMDCDGALQVMGGYSGAPVWSSDLNGFVGIVVTERKEQSVAWCIPSRLLCEFYEELPVRFRIPPSDRPRIHDREEDDPNLQLFGDITNNGSRRLSASIQKNGSYYVVQLRYECLADSHSARGKFVTFITHPDFEDEGEDAYELFSSIKGTAADCEFYPEELFTVAAIGDGCDTALTLNLETEFKKQKKRKTSAKKAASKRQTKKKR